MEPLALGADWQDPLPLISFDAALERSLLASGLSREALLNRLLQDVAQPWLHPLLWVLPRRWRQVPAALPPRLQGLSALLQQGLISPVFLAALVDDLAHLWPPGPDAATDAVSRWRQDAIQWQGLRLTLPTDLAGLHHLATTAAAQEDGAASDPAVEGAAERWHHLRQGLRWTNVGLAFSQSAPRRCANAVLAQVLNRLAANSLGGEPFCFEGCRDGASLLQVLTATGWRVRARLRSSIASFGFGASLNVPDEPVRQIPLALPMRTGLLDANGDELLTLLPHTALELQLSRADVDLRLQWYQGTGGLCGWDGLNDLHRPWQNDRGNGTVRYLEAPFSDLELPTLMQLSELIALVHNLEAAARHLRLGGYGSLGFCIDSTALLQQGLRGRCDLYPLVLPGLWRERLADRCNALQAAGQLPPALQPVAGLYRQALQDLPLDLAPHGEAAVAARRRLLASLPLHSPFALVQRLQRLQAPSPPEGSGQSLR